MFLVVLIGTTGICVTIWLLSTTAASTQQALSRGELFGALLFVLLLILTGLTIYKRVKHKGQSASASRHLDSGDNLTPLAPSPDRGRPWIWLVGGLVLLLLAGGGLILARGRSGAISAFGPVGELPGYPDEIWNVAFSPDGTLLAAGGSRRAVMVWDLTTAKSEYYLEPADLGVITGLAFSSNGNRLIAGGNAEFWYWDTYAPSSMSHMRPSGFGLTTMLSTFYLTQASGRAAFADAFGNVVIAEISPDGVPQKITELGDPEATSSTALAFNADGSVLFSASNDHIVQWDMETGQQIGSLTVGGPVIDIALNSDGTAVAVGSDNSETEMSIIQIWDIQTGKLETALGTQKGRITSITFSPDGTLIASGSTEEMIYIWDVKSQKQIAEFKGQTGWGKSLAFSPDSALLASGGNDGVVRLWSIGREVPSHITLIFAQTVKIEPSQTNTVLIPVYKLFVIPWLVGGGVFYGGRVLRSVSVAQQSVSQKPAHQEPLRE